MDTNRNCEFCGCITNARQRRCCLAGEKADRKRNKKVNKTKTVCGLEFTSGDYWEHGPFYFTRLDDGRTHFVFEVDNKNFSFQCSGYGRGPTAAFRNLWKQMEDELQTLEEALVLCSIEAEFLKKTLNKYKKGKH